MKNSNMKQTEREHNAYNIVYECITFNKILYKYGWFCFESRSSIIKTNQKKKYKLKLNVSTKAKSTNLTNVKFSEVQLRLE